MASALIFRCHSCKARIKVAIKLLGQVRPCPRCKTSLRVHIKAPEDSSSILISDSAAEPTEAGATEGR
jgi:hypothetical protein